MNVTFPSLRHIALVKSCCLLWNDNEVNYLITKLFFDLKIWKAKACFTRTYEWFVIECKIREKIICLYLPENLKENLMDIFQHIGFEIANWCYQNKMNFDKPEDFIRFLKKLVWSPLGIINVKQTAKLIISEYPFKLINFEIACENCIEEDIIKFYDKLPFNVKEDHFEYVSKNMLHNYLQFLWMVKIEIMKHGVENHSYYSSLLQEKYASAFTFCAVNRNKPATEYLFMKLTQEQKDMHLVKLTKYIVMQSVEEQRGKWPMNYFDIIAYLLSVMSISQLEEFYKTNCLKLLMNFISWPWRDYFLKMLNK